MHIMKKTTSTFCILVMALGTMMGLAPVSQAASKTEAAVTQPAKTVSINQASLEELQTVRGIGPAIAQRIMDYRKEHGRFEKVEDLAKVRGIGEAKFERIRSQISI